MTLAFTIIGGICAAAIAAVLAHHDPLDVEVVGNEGYGDVGPAKRVRRRVRKRRKPLGSQPIASELRCGGHDLSDPLPADPTTSGVRHEIVIGAGREPRSPQPVDVLDDHLCEVGTDQDDALAGLGLCVEDSELRAFGVVQADCTDF